MIRHSIWFVLELLMAYILAFVVVERNKLIGSLTHWYDMEI